MDTNRWEMKIYAHQHRTSSDIQLQLGQRNRTLQSTNGDYHLTNAKDTQSEGGRRIERERERLVHSPCPVVAG